MLFRSKLCEVCNSTLGLAFDSIDEHSSKEVSHHATKESLVDSVLHRSCHLCRFIIYHLRLRWASQHRKGKDDLREEPTSLTEADFEESDFEFATFRSDRKTVLSYMLELDEELKLHAQIKKYGDGKVGVFGLIEFDCDGFDSDIPRFWIFDDRAFGTSPITNRLNDSTEAASSQAVVRSWLDECKNHDDCKSQRQCFLPTRLLDIGDVDTTSTIRLVLSKYIDPTAHYVTLSHCWGAVKPFQLSAETEEMMKTGFGLKGMPRTFQDAIAVARWAGVRYIWIDSCCIVQGSKSDWEKEAKTMQDVYKHTYFNISADHSENSLGGCFIDRLAYKITPCPYTSPKVGQVYFVPQFDLTRPLVESPIAKRAWVSQERFLSPRILHFTAEQIFWECAGLYACETFPHGMPHVYEESTSHHYSASLDRILAHQEDNATIYEIWNQICQDYASTKLTYTSDRLIAFAGIVREFRSRLPNVTYLAGLWSADIINGLLWKVTALDGWPTQPNGSRELYADPHITASIPATYRAPSWSWLGKNCDIFTQIGVCYQPKDLAEVLEAKVELVNVDEPAGDIQGGHIKVRGYLRAAQWRQDGLIDTIVLDGKSGDQLRTTLERKVSPKGDSFVLQRDTGTEFPIKDIFCFPIRLSTLPGYLSEGVRMVEGLILGPTEKQGQYQRLGSFEAIGVGHCRALIFELLPAAQELSQPWKSLTPGLVTVTDEAQDGDGSQYDDEYFKHVEERVFTII